MSTDSQKFSRDLVWNIAGLAVSGACGIILNALIGLVYDEAALGIFNQVFAGYIFFSQIAVLGVHHSALQGVAAAAQPSAKSEIATAAVLVTALLGAVAALTFWMVAPLVADVLSSDEVGVGMLYAAPGLFFFALDKVTFACVNAERRMGWYAILQGSRFVFMLIGFGLCIYLEVERSTLPIILTGSEILTFCLSLMAMRSLLRPLAISQLLAHGRVHMDFGVRGFMSGVLADLHSRVDVLMLGYFSTDAIVGMYSFAAILVEGFFQLLVVLRANYAPICVRLLAEDSLQELSELIRRGRNRVYLVSFPLAAVLVLAYTFALPLFIADRMVGGSANYFAILMAGVAVSAGYMPFLQILLHAKRPGMHTWLMVGTVCINIAANAALIPLWGGVGAALGTALAFAASVLLLKILSRRLLFLDV